MVKPKNHFHIQRGDRVRLQTFLMVHLFLANLFWRGKITVVASM
jgi:hypothetical protein